MTEMLDMKLQMLKSKNSLKTGRSHEVSNITEDEQDHQMKTQGRAQFQDIDSPSPTPVSIWETIQNLAYPNSPNSLASKEMVKKPPTQLVDSPLKTESWLGDRGPSVPGHLGAQATYKLPTLEVPTFSGESSKQFFKWWPSFRDVYQQNPGLDSASKLAYLKRHLKGHALQVASSHSTYDDAIGNLHQIYGKERDLFSEMTMELDQLKEKNVNLLDLLLAVNSYVALFKLIDQDSRQLAALLIQPIEHKLPMEVLLQWRVRVQTMDKCGEPVLISDFSQFLIDSINLYDSPLVQARTTQQKKERKSEKLAAPQQARRSLPAEPKSTLMFNAVGSMQYKKCPFCQGKPHVEVRKCRKVNAFPPGTIKQLAQTNHLCYMCLTHHGRKNCSTPRCKKCNGAHHALLHMDYYDCKENVHPGNQRAARRTPVHSIRPRENPWNSENQKSQQQRPPSQEDRAAKRDPTPETRLALTSLAPKAMESVLPVLELKIKGPDGHSMGIYALLDSGCTTSFIKRSLASALGLRGSSVSLQIQTLGNNLTVEKNHKLVNFTIENATVSLSMTAATIKTICSDIRTINYTTEESINMACPRKTGKVPISLLIGVDYLGEIYGTHRTSTKNWGLSLISTKFGHCLMGSTSKHSPPHRGNQSTAMQTVTVMMGKTSIEQDLEKLWTLEAMGILDQEEEKWTASELQAVQHFQQNTKLEGKRYEVSLPFSEPTPPIENNFIQALNCLEALERRWSRDAEFAAAYKNAMEEYFERGYAHVLANDELEKNQGVFYLPHSAVKREESTSTKMRIVFNASAVYKGSSLNQFTLTGPKLQKDILDILLKMRTKRIVVAGDISKMFLQIKITDNDRNYVRFLWRDQRTERLTVCQFSSLVFGLSCSPFLANAVIQDLANRNAQVNPMASYTLKNDIYVDDVFIYADTADEALENLRQVTNTLEQGSFKLTKFFSNSPIVCKAIPSEELNPKALLHLKPHEQKGKALGVAFHTNTDELVFQVHALTNQWKSTPIETKRSVLSKLAGIFDPLGLVAPQTIRLKICMQNIWKRGNINWNDTLPT
ncbi:uncharacterized protein LOC131880779 [Tigriopus californicus]|uniref:uncharacterized protein LOC131880779 n=1 Tax=Tigriopus californicus TaxID=6832 RepID=UPI0027DA7431|nr:uncharacterized protein LOC131880779 [Tigriopus californicus]